MSQALPVIAVVVAIVAGASYLFKNNQAIAAPAMMIAAFAGALVAGMGFRPREVVEGMFGLFYPVLGVICGMILVRIVYDGGAFDLLFAKIAGMSGALRSIMLLCFIGIPGMITGTATASLLTTGTLAGGYLIKSGMDKTKATIFVAAGSFIGMMLPPMSLPAIISVSTAIASGGYFAAYNGYTVPLLVMGLPALIVFGAMAAKDLPEKIKTPAPAGSATGLLPLCVVFLLGFMQDFLYSVIPFFLGFPLIFMIGALLALVFGGGKKINMFDSVTGALRDIAPPAAIAMAGGSILEVYMMTGTAGWVGVAQYFTGYQTVGLIFGLIILVLALVADAPAGIAVAVLACFVTGNNITYSGAAVATMPMFYAAIIGIAAVISMRSGFGSRVARAIGADEVTDRTVVTGMIIPIILVLVVGLAFAYMGGSLAALRI